MSSRTSFAAFVEALGMATSAFRGHVRQRFKEYDVDLTAEMMQVMLFLWANDGVNQQEIANAVNKDKASLTSMLDNLVRRQLVERRADQDDRRNKRIVLTAKGRALQQQIMPLIEEMYAVAGQGLPDQQLQSSIAALKQIAANLNGPKT